MALDLFLDYVFDDVLAVNKLSAIGVFNFHPLPIAHVLNADDVATAFDDKFVAWFDFVEIDHSL
ncbi:hypothetical protein [Pseudomonas sp. NMI542_15]|uniref:hypothetical protein n=1 Tax=Pseudomonas sp. NMI542_15 TaxID=2903148 RepID=UPI001E62D36A|nr:hypothetical protein [Pseudomonas sp. NMI542_15]MCE0777582.1 hypothetical protein [Pseudomonas sp. NMI542_15]